MNYPKIYSRDKLSHMMDQNEDEVNELMNIFVEMVPIMLDEMRKAKENEDWPNCGDIAHKLKSSMRLWAIDSLDETVLYIETNGRTSENTDIIKTKIDFLRTQLLDVIDHMKSEIGIS